MDKYVTRSRRPVAPGKGEERGATKRKYDLHRFLENDDDYKNALLELERGEKESHWMWFVFPQLKGLAFSPTADFYAIRDLGEAEALLLCRETRERLILAMRTVARHRNQDNGGDSSLLIDIFSGKTDTLKFISSITLFYHVSRQVRDEEFASLTSTLMEWAEEQGHSRCRFTERKCTLLYHSKQF